MPIGDLAQLIASAHVAVVPNRDAPFTGGIVPTKLFEYAGCGVPVIASRTAAIESHFSDAVELVEPGNVDELATTLIRLRFDSTRRAQLAQATDSIKKRYDWTRMGTEYVETVERLIARRRPAGGRAGAT
ncbi:MAG: glycosyltransferase [Gammaproteobacteria bacterium]